MKNKKDLVSLNSKLYASLSLEELEERTELICWSNAPSPCNDAVCTADCGAYTPCNEYYSEPGCPTDCGSNCVNE
jgi:hypothetical protein